MNNYFPRFPLLAASLLALAAGLFILLTPSGTAVTMDALGNSSTTSTTWLETQGGWGALILVIFLLLYSAPLVFYLQEKPGWALAACLPPFLLTLLAGFSIGLFYLPAQMALFLAAVVMLRQLRNTA
ncbi:MAG: hypothetical protein KIS80_04660 [Anaerolineales bacterium]|nr:hypothetical protein [Anaerolineales bacterium]